MHKHIVYIGVAATLLSGCKTMTHHTNTLYFGTSTTLGVKVGASQTSVPSIKIGYDRNEGVAMPLLANKDYADDNLPTACNDDDMTKCMFLGKQGVDTDTYSVLASFGADIKGSGSGSGAEAGVGLAQYFATGHAAIALAKNGGAAVVSAGPAAVANSNRANLVSNKLDAWEKAHVDIKNAVNAETTDIAAQTKMKAVSTEIFGDQTLGNACTTRVSCVTFLDVNKNRFFSDMEDILASYVKQP